MKNYIFFPGKNIILKIRVSYVYVEPSYENPEIFVYFTPSHPPMNSGHQEAEAEAEVVGKIPEEAEANQKSTAVAQFELSN